MPQRRRGWAGAAQAGFGALGDWASAAYQNQLITQRQKDVGQQYIDANERARQQAMEEANARANIEMGLPPDTPPEVRAQEIARRNQLQQSRGVSDVVSQLMPQSGGPQYGEGGPGGGGAPSGSYQDMILRRDMLEEGDPIRKAIQTVLDARGIRPLGDRPTSGTTFGPVGTAGKPVPTTARNDPTPVVGSLAMPVNEFAARQAGMQERRDDSLTKYHADTMSGEGQLARVKRPTPEEIRANAQAGWKPLSRLYDERYAEVSGEYDAKPGEATGPTDEQRAVGAIVDGILKPADKIASDIEASENYSALGIHLAQGDPATASGTFSRWLSSDDGKRYVNALNGFVNVAVEELVTGVANDQDIARIRSMVVPDYWDDEKTRQDKINNRKAFLRLMEVKRGGSPGAPAASPSAPGPPTGAEGMSSAELLEQLQAMGLRSGGGYR